MGDAGVADSDCNKVVFKEEQGADVADDVKVPTPRHRQLRPTSAKASKHKRGADNYEKSMVYEDYEDSEPDPCDSRNDAFEIEVPLADGHGAVPLLSPPRPSS